MGPKHALMSRLHIKIGIIKQFVKILRQDSEAFQYLKSFFGKLCKSKVKAITFVRLQTKKIIPSDKISQFVTKANYFN